MQVCLQADIHATPTDRHTMTVQTGYSHALAVAQVTIVPHHSHPGSSGGRGGGLSGGKAGGLGESGGAGGASSSVRRSGGSIGGIGAVWASDGPGLCGVQQQRWMPGSPLYSLLAPAMMNARGITAQLAHPVARSMPRSPVKRSETLKYHAASGGLAMSMLKVHWPPASAGSSGVESVSHLKRGMSEGGWGKVNTQHT